ncbi:hypothetical protein D6D17_00177 [Aureobasidium pullulans]|nr:hypothetical protein D6D17_00177 [Aureobasidium pullulans]
MAPSYEFFSYGSAEMREDKNRMWAVRSTLMRTKRPDKVLTSTYQSVLGHVARGGLFDPNDPPASPFDCTNPGAYSLGDECTICSQQFFPATNSVDDKQARHLMATIVGSIKSDQAFLRAVLEKHADFIVSRWKKKSREKRLNFLVEKTTLFGKKWAAVHLLDRVGTEDRKYPGKHNIPKVSTRRLDDGRLAVGVQFHSRESLAAAELRHETLTSHRDSWILPYLDAEMLSEDPTLLLSLLHYRAANEPEKWLMFDNDNIVLAEHFSVIPSIFNPHCVVMQGPDYGTLVKWNAEQAHRWEIVGFTKALHLLTAQETMMNLLSNCVKGLLAEADTPPTLEIHPKWNGMIASNFSRFKTNFPWSTDFVKPFSEPPVFDARQVSELIESRHHEVLDELELLQTDPQYVQALCKEVCACLFFESWRLVDIMPWIIDYIFHSTMYRKTWWHQLTAETKQMMRYLDILEQTPSKQAKQDFDQAVFLVQDLCIETFAVFEPQVEAGLLIQKGFERNFEFTGSAKVKHTNRKFTQKDWFPDDLLYWSMSTLGNDAERPFTMDPSFNFAIVDHLCRTDPEEADRISQTMLDRMSDMTVLSETISSIRSDGTRNRSVDLKVAKVFLAQSHDTTPEDWVEKINAQHGSALGDSLGPDLLHLYQETPWPRGKKNLQWLKDATAARASLTKVWDRFGELWAKRLTETGISQKLIDDDLELLHATTNSRYQEELQQEEQLVLDLISKSVQVSCEDKAEAQTVWGKENDSRASLPTRFRTKVPFVSDPVTSADMPKVSPAPDNTTASTFDLPHVRLVKHYNLVVFQHMFPLGGAESQRSFSWQHFSGAMVDAGFSILQSQGSAITLKLNDYSGMGVKTIVLHRPHPSPTVNPVMLRRIAKRMEKWFGWHREMFVEKSKSEE